MLIPVTDPARYALSQDETWKDMLDTAELGWLAGLWVNIIEKYDVGVGTVTVWYARTRNLLCRYLLSQGETWKGMIDTAELGQVAGTYFHTIEIYDEGIICFFKGFFNTLEAFWSGWDIYG